MSSNEGTPVEVSRTDEERPLGRVEGSGGWWEVGVGARRLNELISFEQGNFGHVGGLGQAPLSFFCRRLKQS